MANIYTIQNATTTDPTTITEYVFLGYWFVPPTATGAWDGHTRQLAWTLDPSDPQSWAFTPLGLGDIGWNNETARIYVNTASGLERMLTTADLALMLSGGTPDFSDPMDADMAPFGSAGGAPLKR